jgi:uncharacterized protein YjcR
LDSKRKLFKEQLLLDFMEFDEKKLKRLKSLKDVKIKDIAGIIKASPSEIKAWKERIKRSREDMDIVGQRRQEDINKRLKSIIL